MSDLLQTPPPTPPGPSPASSLGQVALAHKGWAEPRGPLPARGAEGVRMGRCAFQSCLEEGSAAKRLPRGHG